MSYLMDAIVSDANPNPSRLLSCPGPARSSRYPRAKGTCWAAGGLFVLPLGMLRCMQWPSHSALSLSCMPSVRATLGLGDYLVAKETLERE